MPWMLEAATIFEFALAKWLDAPIILAVLTRNTVLGIIQEKGAEEAVDLLRTRLEVSARVLWDEMWALMPASRVVPGHVIHIRVGDFVPADLVLHGAPARWPPARVVGFPAWLRGPAVKGQYRASSVYSTYPRQMLAAARFYRAAANAVNHSVQYLPQ